MKNLTKTILGEIERKAKRNERHYRKNDGTAKCVVSNANINYFDESEQKWKHTDNSIIEADGCYEANLGKFKTRLSKSAENSFIEVYGTDMSVSWKYLGVDNPKTRRSTSKVKTNKIVKNNLTLSGEAIYKNVNEGVDIQYMLCGNNIKENIVVRKKQNSYNFKFEYSVDGLELRKSETGDKLEFYSSKNSNVVFTIPAPYMYDANNEKSNDVHYEVVTKSDSTYIVSVVAAPEWIDSKERVFPITIDPELVIYENEIFSCETQHYIRECIKEGICQEFESYLNKLEIKLQKTDSERTEAYIHINVKEMGLNITDIHNAKLILTLYQYGNTSTNMSNVKIQCQKSVDSDKYGFNETLFGNGTTLIIPMADCLEVAQEEIIIMLSLTDTTEISYEFWGGGDFTPYIDIEYIDITQRASNKRTIPLIGGAEEHFDIFTGDSSIVFKAIDDESMGFSISNVIKTSDEDFCCGENVRLNIHEKLVRNTDSKLKSNYIYTDSFGDKHYFKETLYYLDYEEAENGKELKKKVIHDKSRITIAPDGKLLYNSGSKTYEVHRTEATFNGLKATTKLEGFKNIELFEQRIDKQKDLENQINSYRNVLGQFVVAGVNEKDHKYSKIFSVEKDLSNIEAFKNYVDEINENHLWTEDEYINFKSLITQQEETMESLSLVENAITLKKDSLQNSRCSILDSINALNLQKAKLDKNATGIVPEDSRFQTIKKQINTITVRHHMNISQLEGLLLSINNVAESGQNRIADVYANSDSNCKHSLNMSLWTTTEQSEIDRTSRDQNKHAFDSYVAVNKNDYYSVNNLVLVENNNTYKVKVESKNEIYNSITDLTNSSNYLILSKSESDSLIALNNELIKIVRYSKDSRITSENIDNYISVVDQINTLKDQLDLVDTQIDAIYGSNEKDKWDDLLLQKENLTVQYDLLSEQIEILPTRSEQNIKTFIEYYKEYLSLKNKCDILRKHIPVNYITSDNYIKGFNDAGDLVVIYDKHNMHITLEYEQYYVNANVKYRISSITDKKENKIVFAYNENDLLSEITDSNGRITKYIYRENSKELNTIIYPDGTYLKLSEDSYADIVISSEYCSSHIYFSNSKLSLVDNFSTLDSVSHNNIVKSEYNKSVSRYSIDYFENSISVLDDSSTGYICKFNIDGQVLEEYEIVKGYVNSSAIYHYEGEHIDYIEYPKEEKLYVTYDSFSFVTHYSKKFDYDNFDKLSAEHIGYVNISDTHKRKFDTTYKYDDKDRLIEARTTITTSPRNNESGNTETIKYTIQIFEYDNSNRLLCKKSYTEGKELSEGISIEQHLYNKNGYEIKTITYNSLDPSSKIYKELEVDDSGTRVTKFDQSGKFKTIYDGNTTIQPNSSKLFKGYGEGSDNCAISLSTNDGIENSIQKLYTLGLLTKITSENITYEYTYDFKGRIKSVSIDDNHYVTYTYNTDSLTKTETTIATYEDKHTETYQESPFVRIEEIEDNTNIKKTVTTILGDKIQSIVQYEDDVITYETTYTYNIYGNLIEERFAEYLSTGSRNEVYSKTYTYTDDGKLSCQTINSTTNPRIMNNLYEYDDNEKLASFTYDNIRIEPKTDCSGRNRGKSISIFNNKIYSEDIAYLKHGDHTTILPNIIRYSKNNDGTLVSNGSIRYKYDEMGNICRVYEDETLSTEYKYDALGRLVRENNKSLEKTYLFAYDNNGNIISKKMMSFSLKDEDELINDTVLSNQKYIYNEQGRLVSYDNEELAYDSMGNPTTYRNNSLTWEAGRKLSSFNNIRFTYDAQGRRIAKKHGTNNDIIFEYNTKNQIFSQSNGIKYFYDNNSSIYAFSYDEAMYFYKKDILGNVIEILDNTGETVVKYIYDAWGNHNVIDYTDFGLGELNPIRYRSYYYDTETGLYFLKTRYYDPVTGRFISMDNLSYINPDSINGLNLYCYCENNPIMRVDHTGTEWWKFWEWDWGTILDVGITAVSAVVSIAAGIKVGIKTFAKSFMAVAMTGNVLFAPLAAFGSAVVAGVTTAASIFGAINTVVNSIYYNFLSNTQSSLTPTSYHNGYINRWERLDLTRQETKETWYNLNALRYYGEYNVHMYGWFISGWSHKKGIPVFSSIAESSYVADVNGQKWEGGDKWWRNIFYLALGFLGL